MIQNAATFADITNITNVIAVSLCHTLWGYIN